MAKDLSIKERLEIVRDVREEIKHYDQRAWMSLSRLLGVHYPHANADKVMMLSKIKMNPIQIKPEIGIGGY